MSSHESCHESRHIHSVCIYINTNSRAANESQYQSCHVSSHESRHTERWGAGVETHFQEIS